MPIESPKLDDLKAREVADFLTRRIPVYTPEWTDHNESDPGITLIELFAQLAEQIGYRLNRVPDKNHIELLKLLGTRLAPAAPARSEVALLLSNPATFEATRLALGSKFEADAGDPKPTFSSEVEIDLVPAQCVAIIATNEAPLWEISEEPKLRVVWDGKKPKLKDMPLEPVDLITEETKGTLKHLWLALDLNAARGFRGIEVHLHLRFDDDELPDPLALAHCDDPVTAVAEAAPVIDFIHFFDARELDEQGKSLRDEAGKPDPCKTLPAVPGRIIDTTNGLRRSGSVRFQIPKAIGPIPASAYAPTLVLPDPPDPPVADACLTLGEALKGELEKLQQTGSGPHFPIDDFLNAITTAVDATGPKPPTSVLTPVLPEEFQSETAVRGWLRLALPDDAPRRLRMITFNAVHVVHAEEATEDFVGVGDGTATQQFSLRHQNVLPGTLRVEVEEEAGAPLVPWQVADNLDAADERSRVFAVDWEAGRLESGDGRKGRILPRVPDAGRVIARSYQHGGGANGNVPVGSINAPKAPIAGIEASVNPIAAQGGRDAETTQEASRRARKDLSTRSRAVTANDFEIIAERTAAVDVALASAVPRRRPFPKGTIAPALPEPVCPPELPDGPAGLDLAIEAPGAVSVVVVPAEGDAHAPLPTPSFLQHVCEQLNEHRLVTTEVYVVPPQYVRLCDFQVVVRGAPGYTRVELEEAVSERLSRYLHVLPDTDEAEHLGLGAEIHVVDLVAEIMRVEGVERVADLSLRFTRTKNPIDPREGVLALCPEPPQPDQLVEFDKLALHPDEALAFDPEKFQLRTGEAS